MQNAQVLAEVADFFPGATAEVQRFLWPDSDPDTA